MWLLLPFFKLCGEEGFFSGPRPCSSHLPQGKAPVPASSPWPCGLSQGLGRGLCLSPGGAPPGAHIALLYADKDTALPVAF